MKVSTLLVAAMAGAASAMPLERLSSMSVADKTQLFAEFKQTFNKTYETALEERIRFNVFQEALVRIDDKNAADPHARYGITKFSDMTPAEFKVKVLADIRQSGDRPVHVPHSRPAAALPASVDWRSQEGKAIGKVRNQGQCGSCWAFSTAEQIASNWALAGNDFTVLSVEQIVDCDGTDSGCNGGDTSTAYEYVIKAGGLESEADYPSSASEGNSGKCKFDKSKIVAKISSWKYITGSGDSSSANIEKLETQLQSSPVSICVEADTWQDYNGGIVTSNCGQNLDHCVQLAGYAASGSTKYWIVRNSWGTDWGIQGYIYVGQEDNLCGIQNESTIAIV